VESSAAQTLGQILDRLQDAVDRRDGARILAATFAEVLSCDHVSLWMRPHGTGRHVLGATHPGRRPGAAETYQQMTLDLPERPELSGGRCTTLPARSALVGGTALEEALDLPKLASVALVPFVRARRIEAVAACGLVQSELTSEQRTLCEQIAPHLVSTLETWRLQESFTRERDRRRQFASLAADVLLASDVESTAVRLCELTRTLFATTRSALFMLEERDLVPIAAAGPYGDRAGGGSLHVAPGIEPIFDEVVATGEVIVVNDFRASRYAATPIPLPFRPQAALVMPLVDESGTLGLLTASELDEPHRFDADAAEEARLLSALATVAIRRVLLLEELRQASRAKDDFLAAVTHELRTPLNVVLGYLRLLNEHAFGSLTPEQADTIERAESGAQRQLALVDDLLDLAEVERGKLRCELGPVRVADLVEELTEVVASAIAGRPIAFAAEVPDTIIVHSDRDRLKQVLVNVLANAGKFTERGEIKLRAFMADDRAVIEIADTGVGMEPAFVGRATEPFVRGDGQKVGSGLGLAIVARVLRVLDGSLAIDSRPAAGTTVRIILPAPVDPAAVRGAAT
jgi:signal transduction histidine kinase